MSTSQVLSQMLRKLYPLIKGNKKEEINVSLQHIEEMVQQFKKEENVNASRTDELGNEIERQLDAEILQLEQQVQATSTNGFVQAYAGDAMQKVEQFWTDKGFHTIKSIRMSPNGMITVVFGFTIHWTPMLGHSQKDEDKTQPIQQLVKQGFHITADGMELKDNDTNRALVKQLLQDRFPSVYFLEFKGTCYKQDEQRLAEVCVRIRKLADI